jgi:Zn-dependent peptidase ImmA (M78 family)/transcriptional regulator with XRE-family HTH domain
MPLTPSRLTLARKRRGLTKRALAEQVGLAARTITAYEAGAIQPETRKLEQIANVLEFPQAFLEAEDIEDVPTAATSFRSLARMTASQRHAAEAAGTLALSLGDWIDARFHLPDPDVPQLGPGLDPETAAEVVRAEWKLGVQPIPNLTHLLESHGVRLFSLAEECREVDAFSFWRDSKPYVFLNTKKSAEHSRMDAAHELGHLVMHWHHTALQGKESEREAQAFAGAFLMPRAAIVSTAPREVTRAALLQHKRRWRVSLVAYVYRLHKLGFLSEWHYRSLMVEISQLGQRVNEPHPVQQETSQVLNKVFAALRKQGRSKADVANDLKITVAELEALIFGLTMRPLEGGSDPAPSSGGAKPSLRVVGGTPT